MKLLPSKVYAVSRIQLCILLCNRLINLLRERSIHEDTWSPLPIHEPMPHARFLQPVIDCSCRNVNTMHVLEVAMLVKLFLVLRIILMKLGPALVIDVTRDIDFTPLFLILKDYN